MLRELRTGGRRRIKELSYRTDEIDKFLDIVEDVENVAELSSRYGAWGKRASTTLRDRNALKQKFR